MLEKFKNNSESIAQIDTKTGETWTYQELKDYSIRCALWLKKEGIKAGDIISICSDNHIRTIVPLCGGFFIGANINPWFCNWTPEVAVHYVNLTKPKIVFANENAAKMLKEVFQQENVNTKIVVFGKLPGFESFDDIIKDWSAEEIDNFQCYPVRHEDSALLVFSSGSSGLPKGIQHSYRSLHYNMYRFSKDFGIRKKYVVMEITSIFWMTGILTYMYSLLNAYESIIMNNPTCDEICEAIQQYKVQFVFFKSAYLNELNKSNLLEKYDFSSVEILVAGGSQVLADSTKKISTFLKNGETFQSYGLTEIATIGTLQNKGHKNHNSCGVICYDLEMKIVDANTKQILGPNERGEIYFKQECIMDKYYNNPEATAEAIDKDGWFHTGDFGYYDKDGNIFLVDRLKEVIKYRSESIYPAEIENHLLKHPNVFQVAVVPVPHSIDVEHPMAFISTVDNVKISEEEILKMASVLGEERKLHGGIKFLDKLPETANGKIDRVKLKKMAKVYAHE
ncbi:4-coumarate--CoA ligase 1-like isoform X2 [Leptopilina heterotoma]|nr:4-coumarate--CoA ligase 1-like isoform X2 [Leptopilina heterotoma]